MQLNDALRQVGEEIKAVGAEAISGAFENSIRKLLVYILVLSQTDATGAAYISGLGSSVIGVLRDSHHKNIAGTCTSVRSWRTMIIRVKTLNLALGNNPRRRNQLLRR